VTRPLALTAAVAVLFLGCGKSGPILSGGKPAAHWVKALHHSDVAMRRTAASKLGNIGLADEAALPALLDALRDREAVVRKEAILALLKFGPDARQALAALNDLKLRDPDPEVRSYAAKATKKLEGT
jgi:HEAT repeat protein